MVSSLGCQIFAMKMCLHWIWDLGISVARTIEGDVRSEHPVVMRYLIAGIAISNQRSSVRCVAQNKMFNSTASSAEFPWGITFAPNGTSLMMMFLSSNTIAVNVESAELEGRRISSTVRDVDVAIQSC